MVYTKNKIKSNNVSLLEVYELQSFLINVVVAWHLEVGSGC